MRSQYFSSNYAYLSMKKMLDLLMDTCILNGLQKLFTDKIPFLC